MLGDLRAVTFDFWQTLARDTPESLAAARAVRIAALARAARALGLAPSGTRIEEAYERGGAELTRLFWSARRDVPATAQVRLCLDCLEPGLGARVPEPVLAPVVAAYTTAVLHHPPAPIPGAAAAVRALAARGLRLGIVSNTGRTPGAVLRRLLGGWGLLGYFAAGSFSDEVGLRKPEPAIFRRTLDRLGVAPGAALHVGDHAVDDVGGARAAGMRVVHYAPGGQGAADADLVLADLAELPHRLR